MKKIPEVEKLAGKIAQLIPYYEAKKKVSSNPAEIYKQSVKDVHDRITAFLESELKLVCPSCGNIGKQSLDIGGHDEGICYNHKCKTIVFQILTKQYGTEDK